MRISRPCYDKRHRCPGWAGGGMLFAKVTRCNGGYITYGQSRCNKCDVVVLPSFVRWADWRWVSWKVPFEAGILYRDVRCFGVRYVAGDRLHRRVWNIRYKFDTKIVQPLERRALAVSTPHPSHADRKAIPWSQ